MNPNDRRVNTKSHAETKMMLCLNGFGNLGQTVYDIYV